MLLKFLNRQDIIFICKKFCKYSSENESNHLRLNQNLFFDAIVGFIYYDYSRFLKAFSIYCTTAVEKSQ